MSLTTLNLTFICSLVATFIKYLNEVVSNDYEIGKYSFGPCF